MNKKETLLSKLNRLFFPLVGVAVAFSAFFVALPNWNKDRYEYAVYSSGSEFLALLIWVVLFGWLGFNSVRKVIIDWNLACD